MRNQATDGLRLTQMLMAEFRISSLCFGSLSGNRVLATEGRHLVRCPFVAAWNCRFGMILLYHHILPTGQTQRNTDCGES